VGKNISIKFDFQANPAPTEVKWIVVLPSSKGDFYS
jgi:hypothetical protein